MTKPNQQKLRSIEESLKESDNQLRSSEAQSEYMHILKVACDKFRERRKERTGKDAEKHLEMMEFYNTKNVFCLPKISKSIFLVEKFKKNNFDVI